jgi:hypothetical protein
MAEEFLVFHTFSDKETADDFAEDLQKAGIDFKTESVPTMLDRVYIGESASASISIQLRAADFERAHAALSEYYKHLITHVDKDYYLFDFSDEELRDIIAKPDEWGYFDNQLAQKILADRGQGIDSATIKKLKEERIVELAKPEKDASGIIVLGYSFLVLGLFFLFFMDAGFAYTPYGFIATLFIGTLLAFNKKVLPDGSKVFYYDANGRKQGKWIIVGAVLLLGIAIIKWVLFDTSE